VGQNKPFLKRNLYRANPEILFKSGRKCPTWGKSEFIIIYIIINGNKKP